MPCLWQKHVNSNNIPHIEIFENKNNFPSVQEKIVLGSSDISKGQKVFINFAKQIYSSLVLVISFKKCKTYDSLKNEVGG